MRGASNPDRVETGDPSQRAAAVDRTTVSLSADNYSLCGVRVSMARTATSQILMALAAGRNPRRSHRYLTRSTCAGARVVGLLRVRWPAGWAPPSEHVVDALPVDDALRHGMTVRGTMMQRISQGMIGSGWRLAMSNFSCRRGMGVMFSNHGSSSHSHPIFYFPVMIF